jgi:hypothetical protein
VCWTCLDLCGGCATVWYCAVRLFCVCDGGLCVFPPGLIDCLLACLLGMCPIGRFGCLLGLLLAQGCVGGSICWVFGLLVGWLVGLV